MIDKTSPRVVWQLGRIVNTYPDKLGHVGNVRVQIKDNNMKRPITKLTLMIPVEEQSTFQS